MKAEVSIIIPAYNIAPYIARCLESVTLQSLKNIEIIVIDDGSSDSTVEIIKSYACKDERIQLIQKANGGATSARLTGVHYAGGKYIGFVDGDDKVEPNMFERLLTNAKLYDADISHCGYQMVFSNRVDYYYNTGQLILQDNIAGLKDLISGKFVEPGLWNKLFHRKLFYELLQSNIMDTQIRYNEDLLMNYYLFKASNRAVYEDWCPYHYLVRNDSATSVAISVQKLVDPIKVLFYLEKDTMKNSELHQIVLKRLAYQLVSVSSMDMHHNKEFIYIQKMTRKMLRNRLVEIIKNPASSSMDMLKVLWVSAWPWSYGLIHKIYAHISGINKKYLDE